MERGASDCQSLKLFVIGEESLAQLMERRDHTVLFIYLYPKKGIQRTRLGR